jgi:hypothetical protein
MPPLPSMPVTGFSCTLTDRFPNHPYRHSSTAMRVAIATAFIRPTAIPAFAPPDNLSKQLGTVVVLGQDVAVAVGDETEDVVDDVALDLITKPRLDRVWSMYPGGSPVDV